MNDNPSESLRITRALLALADCVDALENVDQSIKNRPQFRSRRQLIDDILNGIEEL